MLYMAASNLDAAAPTITQTENPETSITGKILSPISIDAYELCKHGDQTSLHVKVSITNYAVDEDLSMDTNPLYYSLDTQPAIVFNAQTTANLNRTVRTLRPGESISFWLFFKTTDTLPPQFSFRVFSPYGISNSYIAYKSL